MFVLVYLHSFADIKTYNAPNNYLPKGIIKKYNAIINGKNCHNNPINSDETRYEEIRKLTTGQCEDYTTGCLLNYEYIKNHYWLIAADLSRQK